MNSANISELAASCAKKICGNSVCPHGYNCGHENRRPSPGFKLFGENTVCPLAKYNIAPDKDFDKPWFERMQHVSEFTPTRDELFAACANCEHAEVIEKVDNGGTYLVAKRKDLMKFCLDCPVKSVEETMDEREAEADCEID